MAATRKQRAARARPPQSSKSAVATKTPIEYRDFVLRARRTSPSAVDVSVSRSPAGALARSVRVKFPDAEARALRESFVSRAPASGGRALIRASEAIAIGKRLSGVLLVPPVFQLLARSLAAVADEPGRGVRIRLDLDASLIDLPWEYLYRPDRVDSEGLLGFLLYDPAISMVRLPANPRIAIRPIEGAQPLHFVGTMWEGRVDGWDVWREFSQLRSALRSVARFVTPQFEVASDVDVLDRKVVRDTAMFHYAGHCDVDGSGRGFLVREMPESGQMTRARKTYAADLARTLRRAHTRVVVLSACNSGFWPVVAPLVEAGVPVVVGVNGAVASESTIEFCTRFYESLALGLSVDEAIGRARYATMQWGAEHDLFDWGLYMVYLASPRAVLFPRGESPALRVRQTRARRAHRAAAEESLARARELERLNPGEILSVLTRRRVLILGRFTARRLSILKALQKKLREHRNRYIADLFTFERPESRDLAESVLAFAAMSRFVVADLTEPRSVQAELQAIVQSLQSVPIVPIIAGSAREYALFRALARRPNVVQPTLRYRDLDDLLAKTDREIVPQAEARLQELKPPT